MKPERISRRIDEGLEQFFNEHAENLSDAQRDLLHEYHALVAEQNSCIDDDETLAAEREALDETEDRLRISEIESLQNTLADKIRELEEKIDAIELKLQEVDRKFRTLKAELQPDPKNIANN